MNAITKPAKRSARRADRSLPFEEMRRLMRVYGPTKSLRKRQASGGSANAKIDSVKRKFYRWFPDLEERFVRDAAGFYRPKFGHEFEMRYREDMRTRDGQTSTKKRTNNRKRRLGGKEIATTEAKSKQDATASIVSDTATSASTDCTPVSPVTPPVLQSHFDQETTTLKDAIIHPDLDTNRPTSASIIADAEPLDHLFVAEQGIFDDVENSFFGYSDSHVHDPPGSSFSNNCPRLESSSSSSEEEPSSGTCWDSDSTLTVDDMLDQSMNKYCEEMLASDANDFDSATSLHLDQL